MKQTPLYRRSKCLKCGQITDLAISFGNHIPMPGDFSICSGCSVVAKYNEALEIIPLTPREVDSLKENKALWLQLSAQVAIVTETREHLKKQKNGNKSN